MVDPTFIRFRLTLPPHSRAALDKIALKLISTSKLPGEINPIDRWKRSLHGAAPALSADQRQALAYYSLAAAASGVLGAPGAGGDTISVSQLNMTNYSQFWECISNLMKSMDSTSQSIVSNIRG